MATSIELVELENPSGSTAPDEDASEGSSVLGGVSNLTNTAVGAGILAIPYGVRLAGLVRCRGA